MNNFNFIELLKNIIIVITAFTMIWTVLIFLNAGLGYPIVYTNMISGNNELVWLKKIDNYQTEYCENIKKDRPYLLSIDYNYELEKKSKQSNTLYQYFSCNGKSLSDISACDFFSQNNVKTKVIPFNRFSTLTADCYVIHKIL
jgi:hypothetical protein